MMSNLMQINPEEAQKKLSIIRRYHTEILFIILFCAIGFLFQVRENDRNHYESKTEKTTVKLDSINENFRQYINVDRKEMLRQNFEVSQTLIEIKNVLIKTQDIILSKEKTK